MNAKRAMSVAVFALAACGPHRPAPIVYDADACDYCRMQISDPRFGAELVTKKGRTIKFDSIDCLLSYYKQANAAADVESVWVADVRHPGVLVDATQAHFVDLGAGRAPMGGRRGWAAIVDTSDAVAIGVTDRAAIKTWADLQ
jgi:copper chaperone NosL